MTPRAQRSPLLCKRTEGPLAAGDRVTVSFAFAANIGEGSYSVAVAAHDAETHISRNYEWRDLAIVFKAINASKPHAIVWARRNELWRCAAMSRNRIRFAH